MFSVFGLVLDFLPAHLESLYCQDVELGTVGNLSNYGPPVTINSPHAADRGYFHLSRSITHHISVSLFLWCQASIHHCEQVSLEGEEETDQIQG